MPATASATAFATSDPLDPRELECAPVRYPRPSKLRAPLAFDGAKAQRAAETLGLRTVEDLLLHLPRDLREARAVADLEPGDSATVVVQVRSIASRSVRRRGMRPLVEATVADESGAMKATFFNQPWLEQRYPVGDASGAAREVRGAREVPRPGARPDGRGRHRVERGRLGGALSGHRRPVLDPDPGSGPGASGGADDVVEPLPAALRRAQRLPDRAAALTAAHFAGSQSAIRPRPPAAGLRRAAAGPARAAPPASAPALGPDRPRARPPARADRALARDDAAVLADRRPAARASTRSTATWPARSRCSAC